MTTPATIPATIPATTADAIRPDESRAAAWCAAVDVTAGVTCDEPAAAIDGWCRAARRAMAESGRDEGDDALLRAVARAGREVVADAYARERRVALTERISSQRSSGS